MKDKSLRLYLILGTFFLANALLAEFIGVKIFSLELTMGFDPVNIKLLGHELNFDMTAGVLLWPVVFLLTDVINEYYGKQGVRFISYVAAGLIAYCFLMVYLAIHLHPADWWTTSKHAHGLSDFQLAFKVIFGQSNWIVIASLVAFLLGQLTDVLVFHKLRSMTGEKWIWVRATGSTLVSQFIDSFVVLFIAFGIGAGWPFDKILAIGVINYAYKFIIAIVLTPLLYLTHNQIDRYLGHELAHELKEKAAAD